VGARGERGYIPEFRPKNLDFRDDLLRYATIITVPQKKKRKKKAPALRAGNFFVPYLTKTNR
jgi:hypothetical protein